MPRDYSTHIRQLSQVRRDTLQVIEGMEVASGSDNADRSYSVALLRRDIASYDRQLVDIEAAIKKETQPPTRPEEKKKPASK